MSLTEGPKCRHFSQQAMTRYLSALLCVLLPYARSTEPRFSGVLLSDHQVHVMLINPESGRSSGWIRVGNHFDGYTVKKYNSATSELVVEFKNNERILTLGGSPQDVSTPTAVLNIGGRKRR